MGITNRMGYDASKSPCDTRYAPPEQVQSFSTRCTESARCPLTFKLSIVDLLSLPKLSIVDLLSRESIVGLFINY